MCCEFCWCLVVYKEKTRETIFSGQVNVIVFLLQLVGVEIMNNFVRKRLESYRKLKVLSRKTKYKRFVEVYDEDIFVLFEFRRIPVKRVHYTYPNNNNGKFKFYPTDESKTIVIFDYKQLL